MRGMRPTLFQTEPLYLRLIDEISQITKDDDDVLSTEKKWQIVRNERKIHSTRRIINFN